MVRTVYAIVVFWPFLWFQPFSLEILSHFDLKQYFLSPKLAELYFFLLSMHTATHIFWRCETITCLMKIAFFKMFNFSSR